MKNFTIKSENNSIFSSISIIRGAEIKEFSLTLTSPTMSNMEMLSASLKGFKYEIEDIQYREEKVLIHCRMEG